jgi:2-oxoglutarate ferredoxin oxidoreductase subunit alpha
VSFVHLRYLNPLPKNLGDLLGRFDKVLVPEMNQGQLATLLRDKLCVEPVPLNKVTGQPFLIRELVDKIESVRGGAS